MDPPAIELSFASELRMFLAMRHRPGPASVRPDGTSSLGHVVESLGVPRTEVGALLVDGEPAGPGYRPRGGEHVEVLPVARPQRIPAPRFILDVHLGALARRMRIVGIDTAYPGDIDDADLVELANAGQRVLLTKDRGLLHRKKLWLGGYVRGERPDDQLRDVLDRFRPPLAPWTRCTACNEPLSPVPKRDVEQELLPGTRRTYERFSRCARCGRVYWRGAHSRRLGTVVADALRFGS